MTRAAAIRAEADRLIARFLASGAARVEADILQPAATLLDLYGEDIRARAYVTADPVQGEQMLRPDFTVPVVQAHMAEDRGAARYCYAGRVFRHQETPEPGRPAEFIQVGLEILGGADPAADEAEVLAEIRAALAPLNLRTAIGDIGLLRAAVTGLALTPAREAALLRHLWRPKRFRALLSRYAHQVPAPQTRTSLLDRLAVQGAEALIREAGPMIGCRRKDEIETRLNALAAEDVTPPIDKRDLGLLDQLLGLAGPAPAVLSRLDALAKDMPALFPAVDRFQVRIDALFARGIAPETLDFEASYGRTTLEYYDGFVFGFLVPDRPDLPPVASGGRYDALTRALGHGATLPAVGGVIRPEVALQAGGAAWD